MNHNYPFSDLYAEGIVYFLSKYFLMLPFVLRPSARVAWAEKHQL